MAWRASASTYREFITQLRALGVIESDRVENAMRAVDRARYTPPGATPYVDAPQSIGYAQTISAPHMHAMALELLSDNLYEGANVLDVGCGSGYLTACMAHMVGEHGHVTGIDVLPQLVDWSISNIQADQPQLLSSGRVTITQADGWKGVPDRAPFSAIHVGAAAAELPRALVDQLAVNGTMVVPVGVGDQNLYLIRKKPDGSVDKSVITGVRYVPLIKPRD